MFNLLLTTKSLMSQVLERAGCSKSPWAFAFSVQLRDETHRSSHDTHNKYIHIFGDVTLARAVPMPAPLFSGSCV